MTKQQKQTRKRGSQASGSSGKNAKQSRYQTRDGEGSKSGGSYVRFCTVVVVLCAVCAVFLLWKKPNFQTAAYTTIDSTQDLHTAQKGETDIPPGKRIKRDQQGIKDIYLCTVIVVKPVNTVLVSNQLVVHFM